MRFSVALFQQLSVALCSRLLKMVSSTVRTVNWFTAQSAPSHVVKITHWLDTSCWPAVIMATGLKRDLSAKVKKEIWPGPSPHCQYKIPNFLFKWTNNSGSHFCFHSFSLCHGSRFWRGVSGHGAQCSFCCRLDQETTETEKGHLWAEQVKYAHILISCFVLLFYSLISVFQWFELIIFFVPFYSNSDIEAPPTESYRNSTDSLI